MDDEREIVFPREFPLCEPPVFLIFYLLPSFWRKIRHIHSDLSAIGSIEIVVIESCLPYRYDDISIFSNQGFRHCEKSLCIREGRRGNPGSWIGSFLAMTTRKILRSLGVQSNRRIKDSWKSPSQWDRFFRRFDIAADLNSFCDAHFLHIRDNLVDARLECIPVTMWVRIEDHIREQKWVIGWRYCLLYRYKQEFHLHIWTRRYPLILR